MRYIIEFIALLGRISMFEDKTYMSSNSTLQAACISFDYMWSYCAIWALIWSVTSVANADYNGVMIPNDTELTICLRTYIVCSLTYLRTYVLCSATCFGAYVLCLRTYVLMS